MYREGGMYFMHLFIWISMPPSSGNQTQGSAQQKTLVFTESALRWETTKEIICFPLAVRH